MENVHLIVIGAQKAATTWLQHLFDYNDSVFYVPKHMQEINYFGKDYERKGLEGYRNLYFGGSGNKITCDVSPGYLTNPDVPKRVHEFATKYDKKVKFVMVYREPVARFLSAYQMKLRKGSQISLKEAMQNESLLDNGLYYKHISQYMKYFNKKDFLFICFDNIQSKNDEVIQQIKSFLGIKEELKDPYKGKGINTGGLVKCKFINQLLSYGGVPLRFFKLNKFLHWLKSSFILQKIYKLNKRTFELKKEDTKHLESLKHYYKEDIYKFAKHVRDKTILQKWDYNSLK